jgi:hypothetical protein
MLKISLVSRHILAVVEMSNWFYGSRVTPSVDLNEILQYCPYLQNQYHSRDIEATRMNIYTTEDDIMYATVLKGSIYSDTVQKSWAIKYKPLNSPQCGTKTPNKMNNK